MMIRSVMIFFILEAMMSEFLENIYASVVQNLNNSTE